MSDELKVLFVAAEAVPFVKVGGLAEFAGALPKALRRLGVDVRVMVPRYSDGDHTKTPKLKRVGGSIPVPVGSREEPAHLLSTQVGDVPVYLIFNDQHFGNRERVYGFNDDPQRFTFFSRAVLAALPALDWVPDVIHVNDWHAAPIAAWLDVYGRQDPGYRDMASLFTIHNFAYQGVCGRLLLSFGQMPNLPHLDVEPVGKVNWMAQGIAHADLVSTVSPTYAQEMLAGSLGGDLQPLLQRRQDRFFGILSGIDTEAWNPSSDEALTQKYDAESLNMRSVNKTALQRELRLPVDMDVPLLGSVTRLDPLKGIDILAEALPKMMDARELQVVVLGTGMPELAEKLQSLQARYPRNVRALIRFDERLARRIYGSADMFVLPSEYEAVSVALMTAMHYGAVPIVHAVGGLLDTVLDADGNPERGTGFAFDGYSVPAFLEAADRALAAYDDEARWVSLQRRAMMRDSSWATSAKAYLDLYQRARRLHESQ
ncbi:MAG: glycogen synthase [Anaerolineae bacterium]